MISRHRFALLAAMLLASSLCAGSVAAAGLPPIPDDPPVLNLKGPPDRSFMVSAGAAWGVQEDPFLEQVYGDDSPFSFGLRASYLFGERFGVGFGVGFHNRRGTGGAPSDEQQPDVMIWQVPVYVEGTLRLVLWRTQPVIPYVRGGIDASIWWENYFLNGEKFEISGIKWGAHVAGGVQFRLPFPELNQPGRLVGNPVIDEIYLYVEGWARSADNFGNTPLDLSGGGVAAGITLLM